jgi:hypothetical protein
MMGGGAFILLKAGCWGPESAKQAENRLAGLLKVLHIACPGERKLARRVPGAHAMVVSRAISAGYG